MRYYTVELNGAEKTAASVDGKKLYLLVDFGTEESEHILFLDPSTGEVLFSAS